MNLFGVDILQLIIYLCVGASLIVVVYILKLTRNKTKTKPNPSEETFSEVATMNTPEEIIIIKQLIALIDKMWSHSVGVSPSFNSCSTAPSASPRKRRTRKKLEPEIKELPPPPTPSHSIQKIDEETYTPTEEDQQLLETIRKQLEGEK